MKIVRIMAAFILTAVLLTLISAADDSDGCSGFYFGPDITEDGTYILGQSSDASVFVHTYYEIHEAVNDKSGRVIKGISGFEYQLPATTYRYTLNISNTITFNGVKSGGYAGGGSINSMGVACTGSISGNVSESALKADPYVEDGLGEDVVCAIVGACASSSRGAVNLLIDIIKERGSSESNIFIIADQNEAWYLEIYTGHQYAAVRLPNNAALFTGNEFGIQFADSYSEYIISPTLESFAAEKGFAKYTGEKFDIEASYSSGPVDGYNDRCHIRLWRARDILADSTTGPYDINERYSLTFTPDKKVSLKDVMDLMRDRLEGTVYSMDDGADPRYGISNNNVDECHIIQVYKDRPKECCCVKWNLLGNTAFSVFIPTIADVRENMKEFSTVQNELSLNDSAYSRYALLFSQCATDIKQYKDEIKEYNSELQDYCIRTFPQVYSKYLELRSSSNDKAAGYFTSYVKDLQKKALSSVDCLNNDIAIHRMYSNKLGTYDAFFNVNDTASRYGWEVVLNDRTLTLTHGSDKITIYISDPYDYTAAYTKAVVDVNGTIKTDVTAYRSGDSFFLHFGEYGSTITKYDPVIYAEVPADPESTYDSNYTMLSLAAMGLACVVFMIFLAIVFFKHGKGPQ